MNVLGSIRARIMLGFVAVSVLSIACFATTLLIGGEFRDADAERNESVGRMRESTAIKSAVLLAQAKLAEYLKSSSVAARNGMSEQIAKLAEALGPTLGEANARSLKSEAEAAVSAIDGAAAARGRLTEAVTGLGNPGVALASSTAPVGDAELGESAAYLQFALGQLAQAASRLASTGEIKFMEAIETEAKRIQATADAIDRSPAAPSGRDKKISATNRVTKVIQASAGELVASLDRRDNTSAQLAQELEHAADFADARQTEASARFDAAVRRSSAASDRLFAALVVGTLIVASAGVGLTILIGGSIARPIVALRDAIARIAAGEFETEIPGASRRDEIGQMANSVEVFRRNGLRLRETEAKAEEMRASAEAERSRNDAVKAANAAEQSRVVEDIADGLARLSKGELAFRIERDFPNAYKKLKEDFNIAMAALREAMTLVSANTGAIRRGAGEISTASDDLSRRTEQQAASLEQSTAAVKEIAGSAREMADGAKKAREIVDSARARAETSRKIVEEAIAAMSHIEKSAGQIAQIIGLIDEIAFQTNLLALNAGVEAARAGDAGRGFAVVASEVRGLAQRSAEASKDIKALIAASGQQVERGVDLVGRTGKTLADIAAQVIGVNTLVTDISSAALKQAAGLDEINAAFVAMDQVTQQNAAMVEESAAASHELTREAEELTVLIRKFDVGGTGLEATPPPARRRAA